MHKYGLLLSVRATGLKRGGWTDSLDAGQRDAFAPRLFDRGI